MTTTTVRVCRCCGERFEATLTNTGWVKRCAPCRYNCLPPNGWPVKCTQRRVKVSH